MLEWYFLGRGTYNIALINSSRTHVCKYPFSQDNKANNPYRCVRIWNEIHPQLSSQAYVIEDVNIGLGWISPYIDGESASDEPTAAALLDVYQISGRVVVDAPSDNNFITRENGHTLCVDVGMALKMGRSASLNSLETWETIQRKYPAYWDIHQPLMPETIATIKALLFIQHNRPDIVDVMFLKHAPQLLHNLAKAYDLVLNQTTASQELEQHKPLYIDQLKYLINQKISDYIHSRGAYEHRQFLPSLITSWFRNSELTLQKIQHAIQLIDNINKACSIQDISTHLECVKKIPLSRQHSLFFYSQFDHCLENCLGLIQNLNQTSFN